MLFIYDILIYEHYIIWVVGYIYDTGMTYNYDICIARPLTRDMYAMTLIYKLIYGMYDMTLIYIYHIWYDANIWYICYDNYTIHNDNDL